MENDSSSDGESLAAARAILSGASMARWLAPTAESRIERIAVQQVRDREWPVQDHDHDAHAALRQSISAHGIVEPLLLRPIDGGFSVVTGSRRLRVARALGLSTVPAIVRDIDDGASLVATLWSVAGRHRLDPAQSEALQARLVRAGIAAAEAAALVLAAQPSMPTFVVTTSRKTVSRLRRALDARPKHPRFVAVLPPQPPLLPQAATMALVSVLRDLDPATVLRPDTVA